MRLKRDADIKKRRDRKEVQTVRKNETERRCRQTEK